jgi:sugar phosphate isomerase/epimerase
MMKPILSISTVAFDGYGFQTAFEEIAALGTKYVEVAFIQGYTDPFTEDYFNQSNARAITGLLSRYGLECFAFSSHINLGGDDAEMIFAKRMRFARMMGASLIISNAAPVPQSEVFLRNIRKLALLAEKMELTIGLENPGDGIPNVLDTGRDAESLIESIGSERVRINYDFGNLVSHKFGTVDPGEDYKPAVKVTGHYHLKDVRKGEHPGWVFTEIGKGAIGYGPILCGLAELNIPMSLEIPLRLERAPDSRGVRAAQPVPLDRIRQVLSDSWNFVNKALHDGAERKLSIRNPSP